MPAAALTVLAAIVSQTAYVPDPVSRMLGFIGIMQENGAPIQLGLRLAINDEGKIIEAEHQVVRNISDGNLANLRTPRPGLLSTDVIPESERLPRDMSPSGWNVHLK
jgi:hypothetical protein